MSDQRILEDLPEIYQHFFPDFFHEPIPQETLATCNNCAMCAQPGQPRLQGQEFYQPDIKCCTFQPRLPNYLVGGLLLDSNPAMDEGRRVVRERIRKRLNVIPSWILPHKKYAILHRTSGDRSFGKNHSLLCPYYVRGEGLCGIWKFRDAVCSTYFCKSVAGSEGKKFWNVLRGYLIQAQDALAWHPLLEMKMNIESIWDYLVTFNSDTMEASDLDEIPPTDEAYAKIWGEWAGREEEFYKRSYEMISALSREEFDRIGGSNQRVLQEWLKKRRQDVIAPQIPAVLRTNPDMKAMQGSDGKYVIKTEAGFFTIEAALYDVLQMFDGRRTLDEVRRMVAEKWEAELDNELLLPMYHNRMVVGA